jgi:adenosylcobyric acid synthase
MAKAIMIQGTASNVGKTIITLGLCRILKQDGYKVAPFKPQNITSNTCYLENGDEMATSQYLQALAAGAPPCYQMNPILLKPSQTTGKVDIIVNGKSFDSSNLYNFKEKKEKLISKVMDSYSRLCSEYDLIVIEGAGSPVELNLNEDDIVNMGMAKRANAPVLLVSDIDRGGIFASLQGTINLLRDSEKAYVKAMIINRFKGEISLFKEGVKILEDITNLPVAGVVPYFNIDLPEADDTFNTSNLSPINEDYNSQFDTIADTIRQALKMELVNKILQDGM